MECQRHRAKPNKMKDRKIQPQISGFFTTKKQDSVPQTADEFYAETSKIQLDNIRNAENLNFTTEKCENNAVVENVVCAKMACKTEVSKKTHTIVQLHYRTFIQLFVSSIIKIFHLIFFQFSVDFQIEHWRTKASEFKAKYDKIKQLYQLSLKNNFEKDLKMSRMQQQLTHTSQLPAAEHPSSTNQLLKEAHKFDSFQNDFEEDELAKLRSIDDDGDTTFIRLGLSYLYKTNRSVLSNL